MSVTRPSAVPSAALTKADTLVGALPWLKRLAGKTVVVKYGGNAMTEERLRVSFAKDVVFLHHVGVRVVVVHGGGPQITAQLDQLGIESVFAGGLRVTTPETMQVVRMVLVGQVNRDIVGLVNDHGAFGVGMSGEDAHLFLAERRHATVGGEPVDVGQVGDIVAVQPSAVRSLLSDGRIPIIASVARGVDGGIYNVNADTAAGALAIALGAEKVIFLTDVEGLYPAWPDTSEVISSLSAAELAELLPGLASGMVPKMEACLRAVEGGVPSAHVVDGRVAHSLLLELFTAEGIGTMVTTDGSQEDA